MESHQQFVHSSRSPS